MSSKRIHKTLEEIEAEQNFDVSHDMQDDMQDDAADDWSDLDSSETFDDLTSRANELLSVEEETPAKSGHQRRRMNRRKSDRRPGEARSPLAMTVAGVTLLLGGFVLSVVAMVAPTALGTLPTTLSGAGLTPGLIALIGVVVLVLTSAQRKQQHQIQKELDWVAGNEEMNAEMLEYLVDAEQQNAERRPASGEELEQVLHAIARQDEKINNITKALKMYGKPLVDVSRQAMENGQKAKLLGAQIGQLDEKLAALDQIEAMQREITSLDERLLQPLTKQLTKASREGMDELMKAVELLAEQVATDLAQAVAALPKGDGSEHVVESMQRALADLHDRLTDDLTTQLSSQLETRFSAQSTQLTSQLTTQLTSNLTSQLTTQLTGQLTAELDRAIANIDFAAPATTKSGKVKAAKPAAPNPTPPPARGAADDEPAVPTPISGTATTSARSVMGAIAKLKKMR